jgi:hypothetical protein
MKEEANPSPLSLPLTYTSSCPLLCVPPRVARSPSRQHAPQEDRGRRVPPRPRPDHLRGRLRRGTGGERLRRRAPRRRDEPGCSGGLFEPGRVDARRSPRACARLRRVQGQVRPGQLRAHCLHRDPRSEPVGRLRLWHRARPQACRVRPWRPRPRRQAAALRQAPRRTVAGHARALCRRRRPSHHCRCLRSSVFVCTSVCTSSSFSCCSSVCCASHHRKGVGRVLQGRGPLRHQLNQEMQFGGKGRTGGDVELFPFRRCGLRPACCGGPATRCNTPHNQSHGAERGNTHKNVYGW